MAEPRVVTQVRSSGVGAGETGEETALPGLLDHGGGIDLHAAVGRWAGQQKLSTVCPGRGQTDA